MPRLRTTKAKLAVVRTDDVSLAEHLGFKVKLVDCGTENIKLTYPEDEERMKQILALRRQREKEEAKV